MTGRGHSANINAGTQRPGSWVGRGVREDSEAATTREYVAATTPPGPMRSGKFASEAIHIGIHSTIGIKPDRHGSMVDGRARQ